MLCAACEDLWSTVQQTLPGSWNGVQPELFDDAQLDNAWMGSHHIEPGSFLSAVKHTCYICSTIYRDLSPQLRDQAWMFRTFYQLRLADRGELGFENDHYELDFSIEILDGEEPIAKEQVVECSGTFKIVPRSEVTASGEALELTDNTFSEKCKDQVQQWLHECVTSHEICRQDWRANKGWPTRLINITKKDYFNVEVFGANSCYPRYVTLSHCWESEMPLQLTSKTYRMLEKGLPLVVLSQRFQDAIQIALWMGVHYIWIDALCIQQDSDKDWLIESNKMGDVYTNSFCNIAATSRGPEKGCFTDRPRSLVEPYPVPSPRHGPCPKGFAATHFIGYDDFWNNSLLDTFLHNRAWVLQERLLSPRTIHFGQEQIFWECRCKMACEAYPDGIPQQFRNRKTRAWRQSDQMLDPHAFKPPDELHEIWSKTVERYMECKLSYHEDKLVAITGIAQKVAEVTGQRYLAGLWEGPTLPQALLWYVLGRRQADGTSSFRPTATNSSRWRAPSWSWASLEAKVIWNWPVKCDRVLIDIDKVTIDGYKGSEMGRISYASMEISGHVLKGQLRVMGEGDDGTPEEDGRYVLQLTHNVSQDSDPGKPSANMPVMEPVIYLDTPMTPALSQLEVYMLPVCTEWRGRSENIVTSLAGLLLRKVKSTHQIHYERIGIFGLNYPDMILLQELAGLDLDCTRDGSAVMGRQQITLL